MTARKPKFGTVPRARIKLAGKPKPRRCTSCRQPIRSTNERCYMCRRYG